METQGEPQEWVHYRAPKSVSFGHQSVPRDARRAWPAVQRFLAELTHSSLGPMTELFCHSPGVERADVAHAPRADEARRLFGPETSEPGGFPSWKIAPAQFEAALQFAMDDDKHPKQEYGPTRFYCHYSFTWIEFAERQLHANDPRKATSRIGLHVGGGGVFVQPHFTFPAPWTSGSLKEFIARIEPLLPFRFRDQYFQRMLPIKGTGKLWGRTVKLDKQWRRSVGTSCTGIAG